MRAVFVLALLLLAPVAAESTTFDARLEIEEPGANAHAARGQRTCLAAPDDPACPAVLTGLAHPALGVLVLDAFAWTYAGATTLRDYAAEPGRPGQGGLTTAETRRLGMNPARESLGILPDAILPGAGSWRALHGHWSDDDGDQLIEARFNGFAPVVGNEWAPIGGAARVHVWIEPGSHPTVTTLDRPDATSPDLVLDCDRWTLLCDPRGEDDFIVATDGSLLGTVESAAVTRALLAPSEGRPYTTRADSLVDLDTYAAIAPGPVESLYAGVARPLLLFVGSPSYGSALSDGGRIGPVPFGGTALAGPAEPVYEGLYAPYPREWAPGSGSTAAGERESYTLHYAPWIDLLPSWGYGAVGLTSPQGGAAGPPTPKPGALPGRSATGAQAMLPGHLAFELRTGLWKDLDGDGFVGRADPTDPYEGGSKPLADDYANAAGEFAPRAVDELLVSTFARVVVTLRPDPDWGAGVLVNCNYAPLIVNVGGWAECARDPWLCASPTTVCAVDPAAWLVTGTREIRLAMRLDGEAVARSDAVLLPRGTDGFAVEACAGPFTLSWADERATVSDCDRIEPLA
ncbi:MAG TPA: hypothetical protein VM889_08545 [Candidatus Thermoplasmatota archaeon]|nr:hypothetical protein [Candidatus Thermoplasmatota archaeon]